MRHVITLCAQELDRFVGLSSFPIDLLDTNCCSTLMNKVCRSRQSTDCDENIILFRLIDHISILLFRQWLLTYGYSQPPGTLGLSNMASVCTLMGDCISMSISADSPSDETLNRGPLALLLRRQYEFPFGINIVQFSFFVLFCIVAY